MRGAKEEEWRREKKARQGKKQGKQRRRRIIRQEREHEKSKRSGTKTDLQAKIDNLDLLIQICGHDLFFLSILGDESLQKFEKGKKGGIAKN